MKSYLDFSLDGTDMLSRGRQQLDLKYINRKEIDADVSVIISHYKAIESLRRAIQSVLSQESELKIELVVVDDGTPGDDFKKATDEFCDLQFFTRASLQRNSQATISRNLAIYLANGDYVIPLDADDEIIGQHAIASLVRNFRQNCHAVFASTNIVGNIIGDVTDSDDISWVRLLPSVEGEKIDKRFKGRKFYIREARDYSLWELLEYDYNIGLRLFPKAILVQLGGLDERLGTQCWYSTILGLRMMGEFVPVRDNSYLYNIHGKNISTKQTDERLKVMREFLLRFFKRHGILYDDLKENCSETFWKVRGIKQEDFDL